MTKYNKDIINIKKKVTAQKAFREALKTDHTCGKGKSWEK